MQPFELEGEPAMLTAFHVFALQSSGLYVGISGVTAETVTTLGEFYEPAR